MTRALRILTTVLVLVLVIALALAVRIGDERSTTGGSLDEPLRITWETDAVCHPSRLVTAAIKIVRELPGFGPVTDHERTVLAAGAARLSKQYSATITGPQMESIRNMEVALATQRSGIRAQRVGDELAGANRRGEPVLAIAAQHKLPPMSVLRQILIEDGRSASEVRAMISDPAKLPEKLRHEADAIFKADMGSRYNAMRVRANAATYEEELAKYLRNIGVNFRTEDEIRLAHVSGPLLTPDYLLTEPVYINGSIVHWIDAKAYAMYGSKLVAKGLVKQATKYNLAFGPGAMVFRGGVMCDASVLPKGAANPPILLDGSHVSH
jgi:hypothetical protein